MERLRKAESRLAQAEGAGLVALLTLMVALSFLQVLLRQCFGLGILWADTLLRHLVLWVGFLGAALAAADNKHFAWEAAAERGDRIGLMLRAAANAAASVVCFLLARAALSFVSDERASGAVLFSVLGLNMRSWLMAVIVPVGFLLVLLHCLVRAALALGALTGRVEPERANAAGPP